MVTLEAANQVSDVTTLPLFHHLPAAVTQALGEMSSTRLLEENEVLFNQDDAAHSVYCIQSGALRLIQFGESGQVVTLRLFAPGELLGLRALLSSEPFPGTVSAVKPTMVVCFPGDEFYSLAQANPALNEIILAALINKLRCAHDLIRELSTETVEQRLARSVLRLAQKFGVPDGHSILINVPLSRQDLAELTAARLETISRIARRWEQAGLIRSKRKRIVLLDPDGLKQHFT